MFMIMYVDMRVKCGSVHRGGFIFTLVTIPNAVEQRILNFIIDIAQVLVAIFRVVRFGNILSDTGGRCNSKIEYGLQSVYPNTLTTTIVQVVKDAAVTRATQLRVLFFQHQSTCEL